MRVALLTNFIPPYRISLFEALAARVTRLAILTSTDMEKGRPWRVEMGSLQVVRQRTLSWRERQRHDGFADRVTVHVPIDTSRQLASLAPDVVVSGELGARTAAALRFGRRNGVPVVVWATLSERSERGRGAVRRWLRRRLLRGAAHVIVNGASGERYVLGFGVPPERVTRVPYTTDMRPFLRLPLGAPAGHPLRVLCVGNLIERKAPDVLLEAARRVASVERPLRLTFVGDGPLRRALERAAAMPFPGLEVRFPGAVAYDALPACYADADLLALPTRSDEWGIVVNEALASGVPVLGSPESQAVEETVLDGGNGWVLEGTSVDAVARGLDRALRTPPDVFQGMRARARASSAALEPAAAAAAFEGALRAAASLDGRPTR